MQDFTTPVGRLVEGSVSELHPRTDPITRAPKIGKDGQPSMELFFSLAIPKGPEAHWAETQWGAVIWAEGHSGFPNGETQQAGFAWKVTDGDSQVPNKNNKKPADKTGFPGNWVLHFSTSFAIAMYNADGSQPLPAEEFYKGCYIQVLASTKANGATGTNTKGVYVNPSAVAFSGHGDRISTGPDISKAGFGVGVVAPEGMSATPLGGMQSAPPSYPAPATAPATAASPSEPYPQILTPPPPPSF